jgi:NitT/TauT family transport system ATP-binding protein
MPLVDVANVTLQYRTADRVVTATRGVSFSVEQSDRFVILGPSGCGKSTILKAVAGFVAPIEGRIRIGGTPVTRPGPDRIVVFQEFDQLLPWKTVIQNITFALTASRRVAAAEADSRARHYLEKVRLCVRGQLSAHALGRHEAARRHRAGDGDGAARAADGRAVCGARRADALADAGRAAAVMERHEVHDPLRDALD